MAFDNLDFTLNMGVETAILALEVKVDRVWCGREEADFTPLGILEWQAYTNTWVCIFHARLLVADKR
jgi:hypothetical protein